MSKKPLCAREGCEVERIPHSAYCAKHKREVGARTMRRLRADPVRGPELREQQRNWFKENREKWNAYLRQWRKKATP